MKPTDGVSMLKLPRNKSLIVIAIVLLLLLALRLNSLFSFRNTGSVDPHINLHDNVASQIIERQRQQQVGAFMSVTEGEVSRTEGRIREATGLALAASIFAANELLNRRLPTSAEGLLSGLNSARLMPPQMDIVGSEGVAMTAHSRLLLRYQLEPLCIEVVSLGKISFDGPALLVRVGGNDSREAKQSGAQLFVATSLELSNLPPPFASEAEIAALGFAPEPFRAAKLPSR